MQDYFLVLGGLPDSDGHDILEVAGGVQERVEWLRLRFLEAERPRLGDAEVVHVVTRAAESVSDAKADAVMLGRERRESFGGDDGEEVLVGSVCPRPVDFEAGVVDPAGEVAHVDEDSVNA